MKLWYILFVPLLFFGCCDLLSPPPVEEEAAPSAVSIGGSEAVAPPPSDVKVKEPPKVTGGDKILAEPTDPASPSSEPTGEEITPDSSVLPPGTGITTSKIPRTKKPGDSDDDTPVYDDELDDHDILADCWVYYGGEIFDITLYIDENLALSSTIEPTCGEAHSGNFEDVFGSQLTFSELTTILQKGIYKGVFVE